MFSVGKKKKDRHCRLEKRSFLVIQQSLRIHIDHILSPDPPSLTAVTWPEMNSTVVGKYLKTKHLWSISRYATGRHGISKYQTADETIVSLCFSSAGWYQFQRSWLLLEVIFFAHKFQEWWINKHFQQRMINNLLHLFYGKLFVGFWLTHNCKTCIFPHQCAETKCIF